MENYIYKNNLSIFSISFIFVKKGQNDRRVYSLKGVTFFETIDVSVIKSLLLYLESIFVKILDQTITHL